MYLTSIQRMSWWLFVLSQAVVTWIRAGLYRTGGRVWETGESRGHGVKGAVGRLSNHFH